MINEGLLNMNIEELKKHLFIVVGEEHYTPLGVIRSLGENGIRPICIIKRARGGAKVASKSKYIRELYLIDEYEEVFSILKNYTSQKYKPFIIPCDDIAVGILDGKYSKIRKHFYIENAGSDNEIQELEKKQRMNLIAKQNGFNVAKTYNFDSGIPDDISYPIITKPYESYEGWKQDYYVCNSREELITALNNVKGKVFAQQYIKKKNELCLDGVATSNGKNVLITIASSYTYILPDYYSMEMLITNFDDKKLKYSFDRIFEQIGYDGIFSTEFMIDEQDELWFLEINFRNSTWSYASTKLGMNLPLLWAASCLDPSATIDAIRNIPKGYRALAEVPDFEQRVRKYKMISFGKWLKQVRTADCLFFYNKNDLAPFKSIWMYKIKNIIRKKVRKFEL